MSTAVRLLSNVINGDIHTAADRGKSSDFECESAGRLLPSTSTVAIYYFSVTLS